MEMMVPADVQDIRDNHPQIRVLEYHGRGYVYIGWNATRPPFESMQVRRALSMGIDRKMIIDNLYYGLAGECVGPFPPVIWAYSPEMKPIPFDPAEARRILATEGFSDSDGDGYLDRGGRRFEFELLANQGNQIRADIQVLVQEQLRAVGIKVTPVTMEWTVMLARQKASEFDAVIGAWRASTKADLSADLVVRSEGAGRLQQGRLLQSPGRQPQCRGLRDARFRGGQAAFPQGAEDHLRRAAVHLSVRPVGRAAPP